MRILQKTTAWLILISCILTCQLTGCASGRVPQTGPTMAEVYKKALSESDEGSIEAAREQIKTSVVYSGQNNLSAYTRTAANEVNNLFHPLPNPQLAMYVYPHIVADDEAPIPGYTTAFYLFEQNHYALPGEAA